MVKQEAHVGVPQANPYQRKAYECSNTQQVSTAYFCELQSGFQTSEKQEPKHDLHGLLTVVPNCIYTQGGR